MFTAAVVTITRKQRQPRCLAADKQIMEMCYAYTMEYYSAIKKIYEMYRCGGLSENSSQRCIYLNTRSLVVVLTALRKGLTLFLKSLGSNSGSWKL